MRSPLPDMLVCLQEEAVFVREERLAFLVRQERVVGDARFERVGEIDKCLPLQDAQYGEQVRFRRLFGLLGYRCARGEQETDDCEAEQQDDGFACHG